MKLLFITSRLPYPPNRGDRLRTFQFLRLFAREYDLTLVSFITGAEERLLAGNLAAYCSEMHLLPLPPWKSLLNVALNVWRSIPMQTLYYQAGHMEKLVENLLATTSFDLAYVHLFRMAPYLARHPEIYRILDLTDLISYELQSAISFQSYPWRLIYRYELPRIEQYEKQIAKYYDEVWFVSRRDHDLFLAHEPEVNSQVVPHSIGEEYFTISQDVTGPLKLLFLGHLEVRHNIDAAWYMAEKIMPIILQEAPEAEFLIVGAGRKEKVMHLSRLQGVKIIGFVPDLRTVFRLSAIAVAPLRYSAGIQNKVVESMAAGLPVVTTSYVSAGLGTLHERDLLVADEPEDFAAQVLRLVKDETLRERLGWAGRAYAKTHFSSQPAIDRLMVITQKKND